GHFFAPVLRSAPLPAKPLPVPTRRSSDLVAVRLEVPVTAMPPAVTLMAKPLLVADRLPPTEPVPRFRAPVEVAVRSPSTLSVPRASALVSVLDTGFAPVFDRLTAPTKSFD